MGCGGDRNVFRPTTGRNHDIEYVEPPTHLGLVVMPVPSGRGFPAEIADAAVANTEPDPETDPAPRCGGFPDAAAEESELEVRSGEDGVSIQEETSSSVTAEEDSEGEICLFAGIIGAEVEEFDEVRIASPMQFLGPEMELDDVSVTTDDDSVHTHDLADTGFAFMCGPAASNLPEEHELGFYQPSDREAAIVDGIMHGLNLVLISPYFAYNWIGPAFTPLSPCHTSEDA